VSERKHTLTKVTRMGALARLWQESLPFLLLLSAAVGHVGLKYPKVNSYAPYLPTTSLQSNFAFLIKISSFVF
jgi:hypothetical protein